MSRLRYRTGRRMITSALYSAGSEDAQPQRNPDCADERVIIADRLNCLIAGIDASPMLRDELIACGLSPLLIVDGIKYHIGFIEAGNESVIQVQKLTERLEYVRDFLCGAKGDKQEALEKLCEAIAMRKRCRKSR